MQTSLTGNRQGSDYRRAPRPSLLAGLVEDEHGEALITSHASKAAAGSAGAGKVRYRYYVSRSIQNGGKSNSGGTRIPAKELEDAVMAAIEQVLADPVALAAKLQAPLDARTIGTLTEAGSLLAGKLRARDPEILAALIERVQVLRGEIRIGLHAAALAGALHCAAPADLLITVTAPVRLSRTGRALQLVQADGCRAGGSTPNERLIKLILRGRAFWDRLSQGTADVATIAREEHLTPSYVTRLTRLAFLSPKVLQAIVDGSAPARLDAGALVATGLAASWKEQERVFLSR